MRGRHVHALLLESIFGNEPNSSLFVVENEFYRRTFYFFFFFSVNCSNGRNVVYLVGKKFSLHNNQEVLLLFFTDLLLFPLKNRYIVNRAPRLYFRSGVIHLFSFFFLKLQILFTKLKWAWVVYSPVFNVKNIFYSVVSLRQLQFRRSKSTSCFRSAIFDNR